MTPTTTPKSLMDSFPHTTLTPIATTTSYPTYENLRKMQWELNDNAESIESEFGDGNHGHIFLVIPEAEYLELTDGIPCVPPEKPPINVDHPNGATAPQITEANCRNTNEKFAYKQYHDATKAIRNQLIAAIPLSYIESLSHPTRGFNKVPPIDIITHLWARFGKIRSSDLRANEKRMKAAWHPPTPFQDLIKQLDDGKKFAAAGKEIIDDHALARMGYDIIDDTGLFDFACREYRFKDEIDKTMATFEEHFRLADLDRTLTVTTKSAGFHGANQMSATTTPTPLNTGKQSYCWTHSILKNHKHTSLTCEKKADGHQDAATLQNKLGGSTKVYQYTPPK